MINIFIRCDVVHMVGSTQVECAAGLRCGFDTLAENYGDLVQALVQAGWAWAHNNSDNSRMHTWACPTCTSGGHPAPPKPDQN